MEDSLLLGDDLNLLFDGKRSLLSVDHDLEALEIGEVCAGGSLSELLGNGGSGPLGGEAFLLGSLDQSAGTAATLNVKLHSGERKSLKWHDHSWEVLSVDEDAVLVSNVDDSDLLSVVLSIVYESNSAGFHEVFVSLYTSERKELERSEMIGERRLLRDDGQSEMEHHVCAAIGVSSNKRTSGIAHLPFLLLYYYIK